MFNILNDYDNIYSAIFFIIRESKLTRWHNFMLAKKQSRLDVRKLSISQMTVDVLNTLSTDCLQASTANVFNN